MNRYLAYCIPVGKSIENGVTVFLNMKDAYLPKNIKHYEGLLSLYGGEIEFDDKFSEGSYQIYNAAGATFTLDDEKFYKSEFAVKRELTEETGNWWDLARDRYTGLTFVGTYKNNVENKTIYLYMLMVDVGVMSFKALQAASTEGIPVAMTYQRFLRTNEEDYIPGVYNMVKQIFNNVKM